MNIELSNPNIRPEEGMLGVVNEKHRVLLVDDERRNINVLNDILKEEYHIRAAMSGLQALDLATSRPRPDLILLDIVMPGLDGFEVCRKLRINPNTADIPVIFITANQSEGNEVRGLEMGVTDFITKPIRPEIVRVRVRNHMTQLRQKRQLEAMHRRVLALSVTDELTGIPNRRRFDEFFRQEWVRCRRTRVPLGLLMMDIDRFKAYNDHNGHPEGDRCLRRVAGYMEDQVRRPSDLIARYGGEEFVCVLPDTDLEGVYKVGRSILKAIRSLNIPHEKSDVASMVTLSIGGTALIPGNDNTPGELIQVADSFLYTAKTEGRNRMIVRSFDRRAEQ